MKVSVIVPVYNVEKYLRECLDSIVNQTYKDIEIILVNDGSPDNSEAICLEYESRYSNIKYFYKENGGVSSARNYGLDKASGDYVYFMDSDDKLDSNFIESSIKIANENNSDVVYSGQNIFKRPSRYLPCMAVWEMVVKKELLDKNSDCRFPLGIQPMEDSIFANIVFANANKIDINDDAIYYYRMSDEQCTKNYNKQVDRIFNCINIGIPYLFNYYSKNKLFNDKNTEQLMNYLILYVIPHLWTVNFSYKQRREIFNIFRSLGNYIDIDNYPYETITRSDKTAVMFLKCKNIFWAEILLVFVKIYILLKKPYNAIKKKKHKPVYNYS